MPIHDRPAMQAWTDGLVAVLDAVGSECVSVFATSESALPVMLLTASHPHRVRSLVLLARSRAIVRAPDQPFGMPESALAKYLDSFEQTVGTGGVVDKLAPSWAGDAAKRRWWARGERLVRWSRVFQGGARPVPAQRRPPRAREHPGADTGVAPAW